MLIDWFTVIAQAINFLILVWLLKRFLYKPILDAIDARERQIAHTLVEAAETKAAAELQRDVFERKNHHFNDTRESLLLRMKDEIHAKRQELLDNAHATADTISRKRLATLQREQLAFAEKLAGHTQDQVFSIARKALRDLADTSLEERIILVFIRQLHAMDDSTKQDCFEAFTQSHEPVRVRTAFQLSEAHQASIRDAVQEIGGVDRVLRFEVIPHGIGGIELIANGRKVAWSIDEYVTLLQRSLTTLADQQSHSLKMGASQQNNLESDPAS
jgi:F-type H+-transporting ATPase subunit b